MTAEQFRKAAVTLFGPERGWQSRCAKALGTDRANVSRWIRIEGTIPGPVAAAVISWLKRFHESGKKP